MVAGAPEFVELADIAAGAKSLLARAANDDPRDSGIMLPRVEGGGHQPHHRKRQRVEGPWTVEDDHSCPAAPLDEGLGAVGLAHQAATTAESTASISAETLSIAVMPSTSRRRSRWR